MSLVSWLLFLHTNMLNKKIDNLWFFTGLFAAVILLLIIFNSQILRLEKETSPSSIKAKNPGQETEEITLIFGGDIMLARTVEQKILKTGDYALPFRKIAEEFSAADLAFANLESPFLDGGSSTPNGSTVFRALPETIEGLKLAGLDILTLANNHFGDQGNKGKLYTFKHLTDNGFEYVGAGNDFADAHQAVIKTVKGVKIGFLGYAYPETMYVATDDSPGLANMDIGEMVKDVNKLKTEADFVIVTMHAGAEYTHLPGSSQIDFARAAVDAGADLVVGHHPHVVQTTEKYKDSYIIYSLGNLVFDQMWSEETQQGVVAKVILSGDKLKSIELLPIHIYDYNQPDWADEEEAQKILGDMGLEGRVVSFEE